LPELETLPVTNITSTAAQSGGNVTIDGGAAITARGVVWSTSPNPTISNNQGYTTNGSGTGSFTSNLAGLAAGTPYYVRAYAKNISGTGYGQQESFTTTNGTGDNTQVVEVLNPATGKIWMDRNLGAGRAATSSTDAQAYGHLYQWGRAADGHQIKTSGTTSTLSSPAGYRIPTEAELNAELLSWSSNNAAGAFASSLKLPVGGGRYASNGLLGSVGSYGCYWASEVNGSYSRGLVFIRDNAATGSEVRAFGLSLRCIKD
jgi:hypothetical protein